MGFFCLLVLKDKSMEDQQSNEDGHYWFRLIFLSISPTSNGAAAAILANEEFVKRHKLQPKAVEILAQVMATDYPSTFEEKSCLKMVSLQFCWYSLGCFFWGFLFIVLGWLFVGVVLFGFGFCFLVCWFGVFFWWCCQDFHVSEQTYYALWWM